VRPAPCIGVALARTHTATLRHRLHRPLVAFLAKRDIRARLDDVPFGVEDGGSHKRNQRIKASLLEGDAFADRWERDINNAPSVKEERKRIAEFFRSR
jgi:hypothetical protein